MSTCIHNGGHTLPPPSYIVSCRVAAQREVIHAQHCSSLAAVVAERVGILLERSGQVNIMQNRHGTVRIVKAKDGIKGACADRSLALKDLVGEEVQLTRVEVEVEADDVSSFPRVPKSWCKG